MRRPRSRSGRIVRNLLLAFLFLLLLWGLLGAPMPTAELKFRQLESERLMTHSRRLLTLENLVQNDGEPYLVRVGTWEQNAITGCYFPGEREWAALNLWPLEDGPTPIPLAYPICRPPEGESRRVGNGLLFLQIPQDTARCQVTITGTLPQPRTETASGEPQGSGVWLFWFGAEVEERPVVYQNRALEGLPYTLELFRADGSPLLTQEGTIPTPIA